MPGCGAPTQAGRAAGEQHPHGVARRDPLARDGRARRRPPAIRRPAPDDRRRRPAIDGVGRGPRRPERRRVRLRAPGPRSASTRTAASAIGCAALPSAISQTRTEVAGLRALTVERAHERRSGRDRRERRLIDLDEQGFRVRVIHSSMHSPWATQWSSAEHRSRPAYAPISIARNAMPGRNFLFVPGPTNVPDRVLRAMHVAMEDHRSSSFPSLTKPLFNDLKKDLQDRVGPVLHLSRLRHRRVGSVADQYAFARRQGAVRAPRPVQPPLDRDGAAPRARRAGARRRVGRGGAGRPDRRGAGGRRRSIRSRRS